MSTDTTICPIPGLGYCLYERCQYWDAARQQCDADCLWPSEGSPETDDTELTDGPCTIHWTEDYD